MYKKLLKKLKFKLLEFQKRKEEIKMYEVMAKGILSVSNGVNIYRRCSHGCICISDKTKRETKLKKGSIYFRSEN